MKKRVNWKILIICLLVVYAFGLGGSVFTSPSVNSDWYDSVRPAITPPNWVFPIVWNILFFLIGLAMYFAWINGNKKEKKKVAWAFGINLFLNFLWSILYFGLHRVDLAFFELILLWVSIVGMIYVCMAIDRKSAYLLVPYLAWVSFAGVLNYLSAF